MLFSGSHVFFYLSTLPKVVKRILRVLSPNFETALYFIANPIIDTAHLSLGFYIRLLEREDFDVGIQLFGLRKVEDSKTNCLAE